MIVPDQAIDCAPAARSWLPLLAPVLQAGRCGVAVDFDGTISPIVSTPAAATIDLTCRDALAALARALPVVAVISGRPVEDLRAHVGLDKLTYIGSHGGEWSSIDDQPVPARRLQADELAALEQQLADAIARRAPLEGLYFEPKPAGLAIHFRRSAQPIQAARAIARAVGGANIAALGLVPLWGKCVLELRPVDAPKKGAAIRALVERNDLDSIIYLGDDRTDADAFKVLRRLREERGVCTLAVGVTGAETPQIVRHWADLEIDGVAAAASFLSLIACSIPS